MLPPPSDVSLYEAFYGLREQPFALTTDPRFLFMSESHRRAYEQLVTGLRRREGLMVLTGDTGMGKTTLCRAVIEALGPRTFSALILNPYMSDAEVLRVILRDFGLVTRDEIRQGMFAKADMPQLLDTLEGFLRSLVDLDSHAVVIIDEAQNLSARVLDQVRVLGGIERDGTRLLQIILVGQPDLLTTIDSEGLRALDERISRRAVLDPLPPDAVDLYIQHRLTVAGGTDLVTFAPKAVHLIAELTQGVPRRINLLCDRTLEAGRVEGTTVITPSLVQRAHQGAGGQPPTSEVLSPAVVVENLDRLDDLALTVNIPDTPVDAIVAPDADTSMLFSQTIEPKPTPRRVWLAVAAMSVVALFGVAGYMGFAYLEAQPLMPVLPDAPVRDVGQLPGTFAPPTEHEERYLMRELERLNPGWRGGGI